MKITTIRTLLLLLGSLLYLTEVTYAQENRKTEFTYMIKGNAADKLLVIEDFRSDIKIIGTSGSEIKITVKGYKGLPEKAKGLKPLGGGGEENTGIGLSFNPRGNLISLSSANRTADDASYVIYLPKNFRIQIMDQGWRGGDIFISGIMGEIEAGTQVGDLILEDVSGPVVAHTLSSDIEVRFVTVSQKSPTSISSTSGNIDITLPTDTKGTFEMKTISGGVYTNMDFDMGEKSDTRKIVSQDATGKLGGGGVAVSLKSISGDIYIRKTE